MGRNVNNLEPWGDLLVNETVVQVPVSLMLDPSLPPSAKLVWMALRLPADSNPARVSLLMARTGLTRKTIGKGLSQLADAGWYATVAGEHTGAIDRAPAGARVPIPASLLSDHRVGVQGRLLYGCLQLTAQFTDPAGQITYTCLSGLTGTSLHTVRRAVRELAETGWLLITQRNQLAPIQFSLCNARAAHGKIEVEGAQRRLEAATFRGEALMREYLSLLVDSDQFEDDAAPGFLVNPLTGERMQLDRFYPPDVAYEFNGPQHYGATDLFSREQAAQQRARDYMKLGICLTRGISLVVIHAEDLSLQTIRRKVGHLLPQRDLHGHEHLIAYLESVSRRYRLAARRRRQVAPADTRNSS